MSATEPAGPPRWGLFAQWHDLIDRGEPRFSYLAKAHEMAEPLARIEASISHSMWNMQRHQTVGIQRDNNELDANLRRKGINIRYVLPRRVAEGRFPLASSMEPDLRLAPVAHPLLIADGRRIVIGDSTGESVWTSADPDIVGRAVALFETVWRAADPAVPEGEEPPFTPRMVDIAFRLVDGATDRGIARALGVSERTVSSDVREMSRRLGARSRAHAIALISGVGG